MKMSRHGLAAGFLFFMIFHFYGIADPMVSANSLHFMESGEFVENVKPGLRIFCHNAESKYLIHAWKTLFMNLHTNLDTYDLYDGKTPVDIVEKHNSNQRSWKFNWLGTKKSKQLNLNPFEDICIGIFTYPYNQYEYKVSMTHLRIDPWKVASTVIGIILFWCARKLSKNTLFYYMCGVTLGVTTSIVILIWFASKLILPRGKFMYAMVATGWTMSFWLARVLSENIQVILLQYRDWVIWYVLVTSTLSFVICYRFGPVTNSRTKTIIQWFLQALGLLAIYYSSHFREASFACCALIVLLYNLPIGTISKGRQYWKKFFPERRRLLNENEFRKEGIRETRKALAHLREFCSSPECNQWKTVLRLKDPIRFAKFMEGEEHLSYNETHEHDAEITRLIEECECTDDEDDENSCNLIEDY